MKTLFIIFLCVLGLFSANAQTDTLSVSNRTVSQVAAIIQPVTTKKEFNFNYAHHSFCVALPVATAGLVLMPIDYHVRDAVNSNLPGFEAEFDDYLQYVPWAAHITMGLCGVKGVSKNRYQILTADAFAAVMMAAVVNGLKYTVNRTRPNGASASFPSGHTATAFTGATLLAHEYGHRSVWIPIAGYTVAATTGVMRVLNNRHYVSDVIVGAAVGILTAELAYWASDVIFKDWKMFKSNRGRMHYEIIRNY